MSVKTLEWIEDNAPLIYDIYTPIADNERELMNKYDDIFKDSIRENTKNLLYSLVCIEYSRCTGESTEEFYSLIDVDTLYDFSVRLTSFYEENL
jgi:hypothetical protein